MIKEPYFDLAMQQWYPADIPEPEMGWWACECCGHSYQDEGFEDESRPNVQCDCQERDLFYLDWEDIPLGWLETIIETRNT